MAYEVLALTAAVRMPARNPQNSPGNLSPISAPGLCRFTGVAQWQSNRPSWLRLQKEGLTKVRILPPVLLGL